MEAPVACKTVNAREAFSKLRGTKYAIARCAEPIGATRARQPPLRLAARPALLSWGSTRSALLRLACAGGTWCCKTATSASSFLVLTKADCTLCLCASCRPAPRAPGRALRRADGAVRPLPRMRRNSRLRLRGLHLERAVDAPASDGRARCTEACPCASSGRAGGFLLPRAALSIPTTTQNQPQVSVGELVVQTLVLDQLRLENLLCLVEAFQSLDFKFLLLDNARHFLHLLFGLPANGQVKH